MFRKIALITALLGTMLTAHADYRPDRPFVDTGHASRFLEIQAYAQAGGVGITQDYIKKFPQITNLNVSMGAAWGVGANVKFAIRDFLALGTEFNILANNYSVDMAITGSDVSSVSSVFLHNHFLTFNFPLYMSVRFNTLRGVKWNVDGGIYYNVGVWGRQDQDIYDSRVNQLGQLVMVKESITCGYYNDPRGLNNSTRRSDIGLYLGTGLSFGRHVFVGITSQIGFSNASYQNGVVNPNIHNINILGRVGYRF